MAHLSKTPRILIVDDQASIRKALRSLLSREPIFQLCGEAENGNEAVEKALELAPQIILMDISMPGLDGLEATRRILRALPSTEILVFTQHEPLQAARAAKAAGALGCLSKSDAGRDLITALKTVSEHRPFFPLQGSGESGHTAGMTHF